MRKIDADAMKAEVESLDAESNNRIYKCAMEDMLEFFIELIDKQPTIEAEPVRHGHWMFLEQKSGYLWTCSNCKGNFDQRFSYCPYCGAEMR
jgi:hypothetical protein